MAFIKKTYPYTIDNGHGERLTFTRVTQDRDGDRVEAEGVAQPGAGPPMHVHHLQEEAARVWPAGTAHNWWNAGTEELRPGVFDAAFLVTRYRSEFTMLELPAVVRRVVIPIVYLVGQTLGKYEKFRDAPAPITSRTSSN